MLFAYIIIAVHTEHFLHVASLYLHTLSNESQHTFGFEVDTNMMRDEQICSFPIIYTKNDNNDKRITNVLLVVRSGMYIYIKGKDGVCACASKHRIRK